MVGGYLYVAAIFAHRAALRVRPDGKRVAGPGLRKSNFDRGLVRAFRLQLARRTAGDNQTVIDNRDAIAQPFRFLDVVRRHDDRPLLGAQFLDQIANLQANLRIEAAGRLIEEEHLRVVDESERDGEPLFLSAGKRGVIGVFLFPQLEPFQQRLAIHGARIKGTEKIERLAHGDLVREVRGLEANADAVLQFLLLAIGIEIEHLHVARRARPQPFQDFDRARLAGAVWPEQAEDFTRTNFEIDPFDRFETVVRLAKPADINGEFVICGHRVKHD
jgi:hypothetical protein